MSYIGGGGGGSGGGGGGSSSSGSGKNNSNQQLTSSNRNSITSMKSLNSDDENLYGGMITNICSTIKEPWDVLKLIIIS